MFGLRKGGWLIALACLLAGFGWGRYETPPEPGLVFLDVGQGACTALQHRGSGLLIDAGPERGSRTLSQLRMHGIKRVSSVLITHPDGDHCDGLDALLRAHPKASVAISDQFRTDPELLVRLKRWNRTPEQIVWLKGRSNVRLGPFTIRVDCPTRAIGEIANEGSLFLRLGEELVVTGDASRMTELAMRRQGPWHARLLVAGHHGSRAACDPAWLREVGPDEVILSCGRGNPYGHPHPEVLARIADAGAKARRTDHEGDLVYRWRGGRFVPISR